MIKRLAGMEKHWPSERQERAVLTEMVSDIHIFHLVFFSWFCSFHKYSAIRAVSL
jgi:hypothetical protein